MNYVPELHSGEGNELGTEHMLRAEFVVRPFPEAPPTTQRWLVRGQAGPVAAYLASALDTTDEVANADGVVFLAPAAGAGLDAQRHRLADLTAMVGSCLAQVTLPRLVVVTTGAHTDSPDPGGAMYWGFVRVLCQEHPELRPTVVDVDPVEQRPEGLVDELGADDGADQVLLRGGRRLIGRLARGEAPLEESATAPTEGGLAVRVDGTYLVVGLVAGPGMELADGLARRGAGAVVLVDTAPPTAPLAAHIDDMRARGSRVVVFTADVGDDAALRALLRTLHLTMPPLRGVFHAPSAVTDTPIRRVSPADLDNTVAVAVDAARNLAEASDEALDAYVVLPSAAALVGGPGRATAAVASAYLDAFALRLRAAGRRAVSLVWGAEVDADNAGTDRVLPMLDQLFARTPHSAAYVPLDLRRWFETYPATAAMQSWQPLLAARNTRASTGATELTDRLRGLPLADRRAVLEATVCELAGAAMGIDPAIIDRETPLEAVGMDSLQGLELRNALESALGRRLPATLLWTYGSPRALAEALTDRFAANPSAAAAAGGAR